MVVRGDTRIYRKIEDLKGHFRAIGLQKFPIGSSCARLATFFAVPEVEIWRPLYRVGMGLPGDQCFCIEIFDFTQCVVARKEIVLHWLKLCTFGDDSRGTGSRKMASDIVQ